MVKQAVLLNGFQWPLEQVKGSQLAADKLIRKKSATARGNLRKAQFNVPRAAVADKIEAQTFKTSVPEHT